MLRLIALLLLLSAPAAFAQGFEQARDLIRRGEFAAAVRACEAGLEQQPRAFQLWTLKGIALQGVGQNKESLAAFRRALAIDPKFLPALQGAAQLEYQLHDLNCRKTLEAILRLRPEPTVHAMLGALAFERKDCGGALKHYGAAGEAADQPVIKWQRATCHFELEQWESAAAQFRELLALREDSRIRFNLGLAETRAQRYVEAIAALLPLRGQADADGLSLLASAYEANKQTPEALDILRDAIARHPLEERLYADLAAVCLDHNAIPLGVEVLEAGTKNLPQSARLQTLLGVLYARGERRDQAEAAFKLAERLAPEAAFGRVGLAVAMMESGAVDEAIELLREQSRRASGDPRVRLTLAQALLQKDSSPVELKEARALLQSLIARRPETARAHSLLGKLHLRRGEIVSAARALETAIKLDPSDRNSTYQLMTVYRKQGRIKEAAALQGRVQQLLDEEREADGDAARYRLVRAPEGRPGQ
ncbi:MAG: tetratricopeptide repeat protein [Blastocatellia bacterium]